MRINKGTLTIKNIPYGAQISFVTKDYDEVDRLSLYKDKPLEATIEPERKKRSLDANSYFWVIADRIADAIGTTKLEVYRDAVHSVGVFDYVAVTDRAVGTFVHNWQLKGLGWIAEVEDSKIDGCKKVCCYYGSSTYNSKQMSRLIDYIVEEAKAVGVDTMTPDEIARVKAEWG